MVVMERLKMSIKMKYINILKIIYKKNIILQDIHIEIKSIKIDLNPLKLYFYIKIPDSKRPEIITNENVSIYLNSNSYITYVDLIRFKL